MLILMVDDHPDMVSWTSTFIKLKGGHDIEAVSTPDEALEAIKEKDYGCILVEFRVPRPRNGFELAARLREAGYKKPIIAFVTLPATYSIEEMTAAKFNCCLQKPFKEEYLPLLEMDPKTTHFKAKYLVSEKYATRYRRPE